MLAARDNLRDRLWLQPALNGYKDEHWYFELIDLLRKVPQHVAACISM